MCVALDEFAGSCDRHTRWLTTILRGELGYQGIVVSDDLDMKAVADGFPLEHVVLEGLRAGVDVFLACRDIGVQAASIEILERAHRDDTDLRNRIDACQARLTKFRATLARPAANAWRSALP